MQMLFAMSDSNQLVKKMFRSVVFLGLYSFQRELLRIFCCICLKCKIFSFMPCCCIKTALNWQKIISTPRILLKYEIHFSIDVIPLVLQCPFLSVLSEHNSQNNHVYHHSHRCAHLLEIHKAHNLAFKLKRKCICLLISDHPYSMHISSEDYSCY